MTFAIESKNFLQNNNHGHPTDFRALCAELVDEWDSLPWKYDWKGNPVSLGESVDLDFSVVDRARAALAAPQQGAPSDERLVEMAVTSGLLQEDGTTGFRENADLSELAVAYARAVLARYGTTPAPVMVTERPPSAGDCDENGICWAIGLLRYWIRVHKDRVIPKSGWIAWLPHWALPIPEPEDAK